MEQPNSQPPKTVVAIRGYALAIFSVGAALGLALTLSRFHFVGVEVPLFLFAAAITAWYGGVGPVTLALIVSCLAFDYFFVQPLYTLNVTTADLPYFFSFTAFSLLVAWFASVRRRVERDLVQSRDDLKREVAERTQQASLLNLTHDTIFVRDMNHVITYWNRGAQEMYGWTAEQAIGKRSRELLQTVFPAPAEVIDDEIRRTGRWEGELRRTKADGTEVVVSSRWALRRDESGLPAAILETNNDITERKRRETEISALNEELAKRSGDLEAINKELEAFAYSISHDLRAPLRHMSGFAELLQKSSAPLLNEKGLRYLGMILESAKRMGNLIDDLLAFSRISRVETHKKVVDLEELVQEALSQVRQETEGRDITWKIGDLPSCYGDGSMLRLAFVNLISNAAKFTRTRKKAEIEIGCAEHKTGQVVIFVRDNGVGFNMKYVNKLFGVFQRLHPPEAFEGTGIGLATVQRIVHRHGGKIWAEALVDEGATFYFSLANLKGV